MYQDAQLIKEFFPKLTDEYVKLLSEHRYTIQGRVYTYNPKELNLMSELVFHIQENQFASFCTTWSKNW